MAKRKQRRSKLYDTQHRIYSAITFVFICLGVLGLLNKLMRGDPKWEVGKCYGNEILYYKVTEIHKNEFEIDNKIIKNTEIKLSVVSADEEEPFYGDSESSLENVLVPEVPCSTFHVAVAHFHLKELYKKLEEKIKAVEKKRGSK